AMSWLGSDEDDVRTAGQEPGVLVVELHPGQLPRLARADRKQDQLRGRAWKRAHRPLHVGREAEGDPFSEAHGGRAVRAPDVDPGVFAAAVELLREEDALSVTGQVVQRGPVQPGQVPLAVLAGRLSGDLEAGRVLIDEDAAVAGDVEEPGRSRPPRHEAHLFGRRGRLEATAPASGRRPGPRAAP